MKKSNIVIVNYGMGNLHSVKTKLDGINATCIVTSNLDIIRQADKIILPGVGHFAKAIENLKSSELFDTLKEVILVKKKPVLGICLGMQLMASFSEEGNAIGFGFFDANVVRFKIVDSLKYKVPHMGWNTLNFNKSSLLTKGLSEDAEFYFVHSYHFVANNQRDILCETDYEYRFCSAIEKDNIFGVQFHPEKSHDVGEALLKNFINL